MPRTSFKLFKRRLNNRLFFVCCLTCSPVARHAWKFGSGSTSKYIKRMALKIVAAESTANRNACIVKLAFLLTHQYISYVFASFLVQRILKARYKLDNIYANLLSARFFEFSRNIDKRSFAVGLIRCIMEIYPRILERYVAVMSSNVVHVYDSANTKTQSIVPSNAVRANPFPFL